MELQVNVSLCEKTRGAILQLAKSLDLATDTVAGKESQEVSAPAKNGKAAAPTKNSKAAKSAAQETEEVDLGFEDTASEDETPTFADVVAAFQSYSAKYSREEAGKILRKFKVKSVKDLKPEQYKDVLKAAEL